MCAATCIIHCKNIRISTDSLWRVFHILKGTFVSVKRQFTDIDVYGTGSVRDEISVDIRIFFYSVQGTNHVHLDMASRWLLRNRGTVKAKTINNRTRRH